MAIKPQINASAFPEVDNGDTGYQRGVSAQPRLTRVVPGFVHHSPLIAPETLCPSLIREVAAAGDRGDHSVGGEAAQRDEDQIRIVGGMDRDLHACPALQMQLSDVLTCADAVCTGSVAGDAAGTGKFGSSRGHDDVGCGACPGRRCRDRQPTLHPALRRSVYQRAVPQITPVGQPRTPG